MSHSIRKHAKLSASGAERWTNCPASVHLSEGMPDRSSVWAEEGTLAHEMLEKHLLSFMALGVRSVESLPGVDPSMYTITGQVAQLIYNLHRRAPHSELLVEGKSRLDFIHKDMWGTYDSAIIDLFGTLHVIDFKYGAGHVVPVQGNLQAIFYALGLAHRFDWNFRRVRVWIIQPRVQGYDGPSFWELTIPELRRYVEFFRKAVRKVEQEPDTFVEGRWCYFCKAKSVCPKKIEEKVRTGKMVFTAVNKE